MLNNINHYCRVCGYGDEFFPWGENGKDPTFAFCTCCGVEYGYQDSLPSGAKKFREKWILEGAKWDDKEKQPKDWNLNEQLKNIPHEYL